MSGQEALVAAMNQVICAQAELINLLQNQQAPEAEPPVEKTFEGNIPEFGEYALEFLERHKPQIRPMTYSTYLYSLKKKIVPGIGKYRMDEITSDIVQDWVNTEVGNGMSNHTARDDVGIIKLVCKDYAKRHKKAGVLLDIKYPKKQKQKTSEKILSDADYRTLYQYGMQGKDRVGIAILLGMVLGMRIGEVCGLKMSDIDFEAKQINIKRSVKRIYWGPDKKSTLEISEPKTESSIRSLPLPKDIETAIQSLNLSTDDYIASAQNTPTEPRTLRQAYNRRLKKLGIQQHTFHDLRHTFASRAIAGGADPRTVADLMGHTTVEMTLNTYTHTNERAMREAVENGKL